MPITFDVNFALSFLAERNPFDNVERVDYVVMLMDFQETHGDDAVQALAGFYLYALANEKGDECTRIIKTTFAHDLNGRKDKLMDPKSSSYLEFWNEEFWFNPKPILP